MKKKFDFQSVGKRMPYEVPDGFFSTMQQGVLDSISKEPISASKRAYFGTRKSLFRNPKEPISQPERASFGKPRGWLRKFSVPLLAAAAAVIVLLVMTFSLTTSTEQTANATDIETAFDNLSTADQDFLLAVYAEDVFMEETDGF